MREFRASKGLAHEIIAEIVETPDGAVWFATLGGGISRFDGIEWETFDRSAGLPSNYVWSLFPDGQNGIWAGTREGIAYFDGDEWNPVPVPGFAAPWVYCITEVNDGALWFGADRECILEFRPENRQTESVPEATGDIDKARVPQGEWAVVLHGDLTEGSAVRDILQMANGEIWAALSESGIAVYDGEHWQLRWGTESAGRKVDSLLRSDDGTVWAAGSGVDPLHRFDGETWSAFPQSFSGSTCVAVSHNGELFVGTREGLWIKREENWEHPALSRNIPHPRVNAVSCLESGAIWIGTEHGAYRIGPMPWSLYERAVDGVSLPGRGLYCDPNTPPITVDSQSRLLQFSGESWMPIAQLRPDEALCTAITQPHENKIWALFRDLAVEFSLERNELLRSVPIPMEYGRNNLFQDRGGRLFLLSRMGVFQLIDGHWQPRPTGSNDHRRNVRSMVEDPQGVLWVELDDVMEIWEWGTITPFVVPEEPFHLRDRISAVHWGRDGTRWIGTTGSGLLQWDGELYRKHTARDGLLNDLVSQIYEASDGTLWVAAKSTGVSSYRDGRWVKYTHDDGLRGSRVRAICEDPKGDIWVALQNAGLARWRPTQEGPDTKIENHPRTMASGERGTFSFAGVDTWSQTIAEDLAYSWRVIPQPDLTGDAVEWSPFEQKTTAVTRELQPGTYIFQVRASDKDRNIDPTLAACEFKVQPLWYQETRFLALASLGSLVILILLAGIVHKHIRRRRAEEALRKVHHELEIRVDERTANLTTVNELLQAEITERKRAEQNIQAYSSFLDTIMEESPFAMWISDASGTVQKTNRALREALHLEDDRLVGKYNILDDTNMTQKGVMPQVKKVFEELEPAQFSILWQSSEAGDVAFAGAQDIHIEVALFPVVDGEGNLTNVVCQWVDVSERKRLEDQLRQAHKMEAIGTLAGGIAHDFNNILGAIIGYSDLALGEDSSPGSHIEHCLHRIRESGERAADLVKHILTFSRQGEQKSGPVPIVSVIKEALRMLQATLPSTIEIRTEIVCGAHTLILGDATQMHQVIVNLSTNAHHAMEENGGVLKVRLSEESFDTPLGLADGTVEPGEYLKLTVSDTGHGMSPEVLDRVLDPFFTTKATGKGTGMGLSVVHGIVKSHGGTMTVESEPGEGTTVEILLPKYSDEIELETAEMPAPVGGNERILLVDDEEALAEAFQVYLRRLGYRVEVNSSGFDALARFRDAPEEYDLVVTDQTMPQMTGGELAEEILRIRRDTPIVLCTGHSDVMSEEKAHAIGIRAFMMKPVRFSDLAKTIRQQLDSA